MEIITYILEGALKPQVARGVIGVNGEKAEQGDGVVVVAEPVLKIRAQEAAEILLFDLA